MIKKKINRLRKRGWKVGSTEEFLKEPSNRTLNPPIISGTYEVELDIEGKKPPSYTLYPPTTPGTYEVELDIEGKKPPSYRLYPPLYPPIILGDEAADKVVDDYLASQSPLKTKKLYINSRDDTKPTIHDRLLANIKKHLPELEELLKEVNEDYNFNDGIYRFLHYSYKVFYAQDITVKVMKALRDLAPEGCSSNPIIDQIVKEGTGKIFKEKYNKDWLKYTRPIVEAMLYAKYFLEIIIKNGKEIKGKVPACMASDWAAISYFYGIRYKV
jgi:hypothetical protein